MKRDWRTEQTATQRVVSKSPIERGILLLVIAMLERTDFFQKEAQECRRLAAQATGKNDREYWLRLAQRWEWLLQPDGESDETDQVLRAGSVIQKRSAKRRAA